MIDKQNLVKVLSERQISDPPETKPRDMNIPLDLDLIISIVGPRRAGKTFLMYDLIRKLIKDIQKTIFSM
jgi:hypothetical protein